MIAGRTGLPYLSSLCLLMAAPLASAAQTSADSAAALTGVREFAIACRRDAGRLWGRSLCGPLITVDGQTGLAIATEAPPRGASSGRVRSGSAGSPTACRSQTPRSIGAAGSGRRSGFRSPPTGTLESAC